MGLIEYRQAVENDMRFVRHSWVESFRTSHYAGVIPMSEYFKIYHDVVRGLMDRDGCEVLIAHHSLHPTQIFGFCCYEQGFTIPLIHYMYVKEDFRQLPSKDDSFSEGIATMLMKQVGFSPKDPFYYTFKTGTWSRLVRWEAPFSGGVYKPMFARFDKSEAVKHESERKKTKPTPKETLCCA